MPTPPPGMPPGPRPTQFPPLMVPATQATPDLRPETVAPMDGPPPLMALLALVR